jgi:hypothetical protein
MPQPSQNPAGGIFQYLVHINGSDADVRKAQAALAASTPLTMGVYQTLNLLPEGEFKSWIMANPVQFWKKIFALIKGRTYTSGDYVLGERLNDNILCQGDIGRKQVSDEMVRKAWWIFTILFGVRIRTSDDLDALDRGIDAYLTRGTHTRDMPRNAVERAVYLKQNYYPSSTYNRQCWDLSWFELYPLVAPIPDMNTGGKELYTGELPGGGYAYNGVIPIDAQTILKQVPDPGPEDEFNPVPVDPGGSTIWDQGIQWVQQNPIPSFLIGAAAAYIIYEFVND